MIHRVLGGVGFIDNKIYKPSSYRAVAEATVDIVTLRLSTGMSFLPIW